MEADQAVGRCTGRAGADAQRPGNGCVGGCRRAWCGELPGAIPDGVGLESSVPGCDASLRGEAMSYFSLERIFGVN